MIFFFFYRNSELILATLIQRYVKKLFDFKNERLTVTEILQVVMCHIYDYINTLYHFIKPFLDDKMSNFEEHGSFKPPPQFLLTYQKRYFR